MKGFPSADWTRTCPDPGIRSAGAVTGGPGCCYCPASPSSAISESATAIAKPKGPEDIPACRDHPRRAHNRGNRDQSTAAPDRGHHPLWVRAAPGRHARQGGTYAAGDQLAKLADLRDHVVISAEEFGREGKDPGLTPFHPAVVRSAGRPAGKPRLAGVPSDRLFHALADAMRRQIAALTLNGEHSVSDLARRFPMRFPAVQKHLAVLERAGLVTKQRQGREQRVRGTRTPCARPIGCWTSWRPSHRSASSVRAFTGCLSQVQASKPGPLATRAVAPVHRATQRPSGKRIGLRRPRH